MARERGVSGSGDTANDRPLRRPDYADAFIRDPDGGPARFDNDDLAENLGEEFIRAATTGADLADEDWLDEVVPEELGGPFMETSAAEEMGLEADESNPDGAEAEALPRAIAGLTSPSPEGEAEADEMERQRRH